MHAGPTSSATSRTPALPLIATSRKALYGVSYVQNICAQAGFPFAETPNGQDIQSIDGEVKFPNGPVYVQVKCTTSIDLNFSSEFSFPITRKWLDAWADISVPIYMIIVLVPDDEFPGWITHANSETTHKTSAYWIKIDPNMNGLTVHVPRTNRLKIDTFSQWHADLKVAFGLGASE